MSESARGWVFGIALGVAFFALAWARRRTGVGRRVDAAPRDAWADIARLRRRELFVYCAMWAVPLVVLWALMIEFADATMPRSQALGWIIYIAGGGYLLWSAFAFAVRIGYRYGVVDAATLWKTRTLKEL